MFNLHFFQDAQAVERLNVADYVFILKNGSHLLKGPFGISFIYTIVNNWDWM